MINSVLIANRGEIAIRIARTCKRMGVKTYGVRTSKEPYALYLGEMDEIVDFPDTGNATPEFLDIDTLVKLAKDNGIEALHPGYGYLSENPQLGIRCREEGVLFIGPSPEVIQLMGDKISAKEAAQRCNIPMLFGSNGAVKDSAEVMKIADKVGFPLIIKAAAGGGGRGMRIVRKADEVEQMFKMATSEAQNAFGDPSVFVEKYLENPRHVEVQVVADNFGNVIHLGERECSIQRKHQKLMEEAPSSAVSPELRAELTNAAMALAREVHYQSLGTVEFLLDADNKFYFMEMNTRIQVEHPITELITNVDLVELQLKIAAGEALPIKQSDVNLKGWAIECRINAEDVQAGFAPSLGTIQNIKFPEGDGIRVDTGVANGSEITPWFDSMVAKLIVYAPSRPEAIEKAREALQQFRIKGIRTTAPFCRAVLHNKLFVEGNYNTSFIETQQDSFEYGDKDDELLAAWFALYTHISEITPEVSAEAAIDPWVLNKRIRHM